MYRLKLVDGIIREPVGGAHSNPEKMFQTVKAEIKKYLPGLIATDPGQLVRNRIEKFCTMGVVAES
jgi:acetyl-CoA carboxylase carboxyl transferase subunit alpha